MHGALMRDPRAIERFHQEAMIAAQLGPRYAADVYDNGVEDGTPWLVMELLRGENLDELLTRERVLAPGQVASLVSQMCEGLARAHAANIVHRDLKPENIFLHRPDGPVDEVVVKLIDFGIAKIVDGKTTRHAGTCGWMAPEQAFDRHPMQPQQSNAPRWQVAPQTDVWALGLIAYRALVGVDYFPDFASAEAYLVHIVSSVFVPASVRAQQQGVQGRLWPAFDGWFAGCVEVDPLRRYRNAGDAWAALQPLLGPLQRLPSQFDPLAPTQRASGAPAASVVASDPHPPAPQRQLSAPAQPIPPTYVSQQPSKTYHPSLASQGVRAPDAPATAPMTGWTPVTGASPAVGRPSHGASLIPPAPGLSNQPRKGLAVLLVVSGAITIGVIALVSMTRTAGWRERECLEGAANVAEADARNVIESCRAACAGNPGPTCVTQGDLTRRFEKDSAEIASARDAYDRACNAGLPAGCRGLGEVDEFARPAAALTALSGACDHGDREACREKGVLMAQGHGTGMPDVAQAKKLYEGACESGDPLACAYQGFLMGEGRGAARDEAGARKLLAAAVPALEKDCKHNQWPACVAWGTASYLLEAPNKEASRFVQSACDAGFPTACSNAGAGLLFPMGDDHPKASDEKADRKRAVALFQQACDAGEPAGCNNLAMLEAGLDFQARIGTRGALVFKATCTDAVVVGCANWGPVVPAPAPDEVDDNGARKNWQRACDAGELVACVNQGAFACKGVDSAACDGAGADFEKACTGGDPAGCGELGTMLVTGRRMPVDATRGHDLLKRGCDAGEIDACDEHDAARYVPGCEVGRLATACVRYAEALAVGADGQTTDVARAKSLLRDAVEGRDERPYPDAYISLGNLLWKEKSTTKALESYHFACDRHAFGGCLSLANALLAPPRPDRDAARSAVEQGCLAGDRRACYGKAALALGDSSTSDKAEAIEELVALCHDGVGMACDDAADIYRRGLAGIPANAPLAADLAKKACDLGYKDNCKAAAPAAASRPAAATQPARAQAASREVAESAECDVIRRVGAQCQSYAGHCDDLEMLKSELGSGLEDCQNICRLGLAGAIRRSGVDCR
jgi:eukaryotic-like serine/threonine-protein kinase